jgi:hypothetical protein
LNCFSQTSTNNQSQNQTSSDTIKVKLKPSTARLAIKDIIRGEGCDEELKLTQEKVIKLEERDSQKDVIISLLDSKDKNNEFIIGQQGQQLNQYVKMTDDLKVELKSEKNKTLGWKIGTAAGIIITYLIVK